MRLTESHDYIALCAGCGTLRTIGGTTDQQLAACCNTLNLLRCVPISGGVAVLMSESAVVLMPGPYGSYDNNVNGVAMYDDFGSRR